MVNLTKEDTKNLTALLAGLAGLATAVGSCSQAAQERLKGENKIYSVLADGQKQQGAELIELHRQLDELREYLQALRSTVPEPSFEPAEPTPPPPPVHLLRPLRRPSPPPSAPAAPAPEPFAALPPVPSAPPAPVLRPLPKFEDIANVP